jgi:hypothetical protein
MAQNGLAIARFAGRRGKTASSAAERMAYVRKRWIWERLIVGGSDRIAFG